MGKIRFRVPYLYIQYHATTNTNPNPSQVCHCNPKANVYRRWHFPHKIDHSVSKGHVI